MAVNVFEILRSIGHRGEPVKIGRTVDIFPGLAMKK
jgi:hypothetical protein